MAEKKATSAHTEQPGGPKAAFPPFEKQTFASQIFWLVICFVALYLLISRIAVPRIGGILDDRAKRIENDFAEAQRDKEESEAALVAYEKALADARSRAQAIGTEIRDKVHAEAEEKRKALEAKLNAPACRSREGDRGHQDRRDGQCPRHCGRRGGRDCRAAGRHGAGGARGRSRGRRSAQALGDGHALPR